MIIMEFEVYYDFAPSDSNQYPLEDKDIEHSLRMLPKDLEHYLPDTKVLITKEDYENKRIYIRIESGQSRGEIKSKMERAFSLSKLFGKQMNVEPVT